jgi:hypothetical protein
MRLQLEDDDYGGQLKLGSLFRHLAEHRLVAKVHAIEIPDGRYAATVAGSQVVETSD